MIMLMWSGTGLGVEPAQATSTQPLVRPPVSPQPLAPSGSATQQKANVSQITNGPLVSVGGWLFMPGGGTATFTVVLNPDGSQVIGGNLTQKQWNLIKEQYQRVSDKQWQYCRVSPAIPCAVEFTRQFRGMNYGGPPEMGGFYKPLVKGQIPLAKTKNPVMGNKTYGIYVEYLGGQPVAGGFAGSFRVTFKPIEKSWFETLWDWLVELVSEVIHFVSQIFDAFKNIACQAAKPYLTELVQGATNKIFTGEQYNRFAKIGVNATQLTKIASGAETTVINTVGNTVLKAFCSGVYNIKPGSVTTWDQSISSWRIAAPKPGIAIGTRKSGTYQEYLSRKGTASSAPSGAAVLSLADYKRLIQAWYARSSTWLIAGGVIAVGGVGYWALR